MKIVLAIAVACIVGGCVSRSPKSKPSRFVFLEKYPSADQKIGPDAKIVQDTETGKKYLIIIGYPHGYGGMVEIKEENSIQDR